MAKSVDQITFASNELMWRLRVPPLRFLLHEGVIFTRTSSQFTAACTLAHQQLQLKRLQKSSNHASIGVRYQLSQSQEKLCAQIV